MESCRHEYYGREHHLIYREELKKDGEKKVNCSFWLCDKPIWGSLHNCVECGNRPVHRYNSTNHCLDFTEKLELNDGNNQVVCYVCEEPVLLGAPAYKCFVSKCSDFVIHKSCAKLSHEINHPQHPGHTLSLRFWRNKRCDACCTSHDRSFFYYCNSCDLQLDIKCANRLPFNPNDCHKHEFFLIWKGVHNCEACGEEIKNLASQCSICKLLVHKRCAEIPRTIKIKLHNHSLNLIYSSHETNKRNDMFCRICGNKVNTEYTAYSCQKCISYHVHTECLRCFKDNYEESPETSESVSNNSVGRSTHLIKALNQADDEGPHLGEIQHFSHYHQLKLILCDDEVNDGKLICKGCMEFIISAPFYSCVQCQFILHTRCAELPTTIVQQLRYFATFTLLPRATTKSGVFFCVICSRHHRGFTYNSNVFDWFRNFLDIQCGSMPETLKHEGHEHPFCLALESQNRKCKVCPKDNEEYVFVCTNCDFILGIRCTNLPLVAKHKYDTHLLKLTYAAKDDSEEYYCLICEEKRDRTHWFYYCEECNFPAHPECVLGNYPCMTIGSTYTSEYHPHPLTFVQKKTEDSPKCHACSNDLDDVVLECSQCKFSIHPPRPYFPDCLWGLSELGRSWSRYSWRPFYS
jgi:hypothetical protein